MFSPQDALEHTAKNAKMGVKGILKLFWYIGDAQIQPILLYGVCTSNDSMKKVHTLAMSQQEHLIRRQMGNF